MMDEPIISILWFIGITLSYLWLRGVIAYSGLTGMFSEGYRWWHRIEEYVMLAVFICYILVNPFT